MNADDHAARASALLEGVDSLGEQLESLSDDQRLQMAIAGTFKQLNANQRFTVELAQAHATTALALYTGAAEAG